MQNTVTQRYEKLVRDGTLRPDVNQQKVIAALAQLCHNLRGYSPSRRRLFTRPNPPRGLYIWGGVGRGKSLLMDLFFNNCAFKSKRRVHFHEFMIETHARIAAWRTMDNRRRRASTFFVKEAGIDDPMPHIARSFFNESVLFCFDEVQVTDIADAMVLGRFFDLMMKDGAVIVTTSNRQPEDLYKDGINRQLFLPAIEALTVGLETLNLDSGIDYRRDHLTQMGSYFTPLTEENAARLDEVWRGMICDGAEEARSHSVKGRVLTLSRTARGATRATFAELCGTALGAADYLTIAGNYHSVFLDDIPVLGPQNRNKAKRFVTLIDALYEHKIKFICTAAAPPHELYPQGDGSFEFERTASRLVEMQSEAYLQLEKIPPRKAAA